MDIQQNNKPEDISIFVPRVNLTTVMKDHRIVQKYGELKFGTIGQVAKNLGISVKNANGGLIFTAPKGRIQMFAEKLHFSLIDFSQV